MSTESNSSKLFETLKIVGLILLAYYAYKIITELMQGLGVTEDPEEAEALARFDATDSKAGYLFASNPLWDRQRDFGLTEAKIREMDSMSENGFFSNLCKNLIDSYRLVDDDEDLAMSVFQSFKDLDELAYFAAFWQKYRMDSISVLNMNYTIASNSPTVASYLTHFFDGADYVRLMNILDKLN